MFDPLSIILTQMDFLKDMILVVRLITLLGGIVVFTNPQLFSSNVSFLNYCTYSLLFHHTNFSGHISTSCNNICSTILGNNQLCSVKSSKQIWHQTNYHHNHVDSLFPNVCIRSALCGVILGA